LAQVITKHSFALSGSTQLFEAARVQAYDKERWQIAASDALSGWRASAL